MACSHGLPSAAARQRRSPSQRVMHKGLKWCTAALMMHHMPTANPRLTITLEPAIAACLRRLSEVTGNSQSKLIAELLEGSVPVFERVIATIEAAKSASDEIRGKLASDMQAAQSRVETQLGFALDEFDGATAPLLDAAEAVKRRARQGTGARARSAGRPATAGPSTPMSNRGVRSTANPVKTPRRKPQ